MPVSFLSKALTPTQYVAPIDPSLVFNAMLMKQQRYDQGVRQTDNLLAQENSTADSIANTAHREYYQQKVADLTARVNSLGGSDFSERSTLQQIDGFSSEISKDPRILGAIVDTKKIQKAQQQMELWKTDRKKYPGMYNPANEDFLNDQLTGYVNNKDASARFTGPGAVPFYDYSDKQEKTFKQIQDSFAKYNYYEYQDGQGNLVRETKLDSDKIEQLARQQLSLDPQAQTQLAIDSKYWTKSIRDEGAFRQTYQDHLQGAAELLQKQKQQRVSDWTAKLVLAENAGKDKQTALKAARDKELGSYDSQLSQYTQLKNQVGSLPISQLAQMAYQQQYVSGLGKQFSIYNRTIKPDVGYWKGKEYNFAVQKEANDTYKWKQGFKSDNHWKQLEYDQKNKFHEDDLLKNLGTTTDKSGNIVPLITPYTLPNEPGSVVAQTLDDQKVKLDGIAKDQVADIKEVALSFMKRDVADRLRADPKFGVKQTGDGTAVDFSYTGHIPPEVAKIALQQMKEFNAVLGGKEPTPEFKAQMTPQLQARMQAIKERAFYLQTQKTDIANLSQQIEKESGMTANQLSRYQQLHTGFGNGSISQSIMSSMGPMPSAQKMEYDYLDSKYQASKDKIEALISQQGTVSSGFGIANIDKDPVRQQIIRIAVDNGRVSPDMATNADMKAKLTELAGKDYDIQNVKVLPAQKKIIFNAKINGGSSKEPRVIENISLDMTDPKQWQQAVPGQLDQNYDPVQTRVRKLLAETGSIRSGKDYLYYGNLSGMAMQATPVRDHLSNQYTLLIKTDNDSFTLDPRIIQDPAFQKDPVGWMQTVYPGWVKNQLVPLVTNLYGIDPATRKPIPGFKPTTALFKQAYLNHLLPAY